MSKKNDLFDLINSMSMSEKRYFKVYCSKMKETKDKTYLKLFNAIDKQDSYDETALKKKFKKDKFVKHFPVVKNYLFKTILKSLRLYYANKTILSKLRELDNDVEILYNKGLFAMAMGHAEKGQRLAKENGIINFEVSFAYWQSKLILRQSFLNMEECNVLKVLDDIIELSKNLQNLYAYRSLHTRLGYTIMTDNNYSVPVFKEKLLSIIEHPLLKNPPTDMGFRARGCYLNIMTTYYFFIRDFKQCYQYAKELYEVWLEKIQDVAIESISPYENYLTACIHSQPYEVVQYALSNYRNFLVTKKTQLEGLANKYPTIEFNATYCLEIEHCLLHERFEEAQVVVERSLPAFEKVKDKLSKYLQLNVYYMYTSLYINVGDFDKAQQFLTNLQEHPQLKKYPFLHFASKILNLIIHYELKNYTYLKYQLNNSRYFFKRNNHLFGYEQAMLRLLNALFKAEDIDKEDILLKYKTVFEGIYQDFKQRSAFDYFNILYWIGKHLKKERKGFYI